jgi:hypothetical protein
MGGTELRSVPDPLVRNNQVAPISLIVGLFRDNIRLYEVANTGWWYDLGFYAAVIAGFGSLSLVRKGSK